MVHAHRSHLVALVDDALVGTTDGVLAVEVPLRVADVEILVDVADVEACVGPHLVAVRTDGVDRLRHLLARRALRDPTVAAFGDAPQRGGARATDPDRRGGPAYPRRLLQGVP